MGAAVIYNITVEGEDGRAAEIEDILIREGFWDTNVIEGE